MRGRGGEHFQEGPEGFRGGDITRHGPLFLCLDPSSLQHYVSLGAVPVLRTISPCCLLREHDILPLNT